MLKVTKSDEAWRKSGDDGSGFHRLTDHRLVGTDDGHCTGGGDAQGVHGLAEQHLAEHGADGGLAVAPARERRAARALEGDVAALALAVDDLPQQQRPPIAQLGREAAELVACVGLGERLRAVGHGVAD